MPFSNSNTVLNVLVPELKRNLVGVKYVESRTTGKKQWEGDFEHPRLTGQNKIDRKKTDQNKSDRNKRYQTNENEAMLQRLVFVATPQRCGMMLRQNPGSTKRKNVATFFEDLHGDTVKDITKPLQERVITLHFESGKQLLFELFGAKANVWLLDVAGDVVEGFRKGLPTILPKNLPPSSTTNLPIESPANSVTANSVTEHTESQPFESADACKAWIKSSRPGFPREHLSELIGHHSLDQKTPPLLAQWCDQVESQVVAKPAFRLLEDGSKTLLSEQLLPLPTQQRFGSLMELLQAGPAPKKGPSKLQEQKSKRIKALQTQIKRKKGSVKNLESAEQTLARADQQEQFGHLLLANAHREGERTAKGLTCINTFDQGQEVLIPLKSSESILENGQTYYQKAKKSRAQAAMHGERQEVLQRELEVLEEALHQLEATHDEKSWKKWLQTYDQELFKETQSRPYRPVTLQGVEVWIGKGARENDECLKLSHKEDWWFHARGVAGSHVYIRHHSLGGQPKPSATLMDAAASLAAWHSKAKGSPVVPVSVTQRKYLQKKKQAAPGEVVVRQEDVLDAEPKSSTEILATFES
ncbi:MAG: NFACT RNA binding domain-containing protein [Balneolaceae bacterium]|nr:NFACT RNA binding domain-containing protein [Balneolaceae bacterium]